MIEERELLAAVLGTAILVFVLRALRELRRVPGWRLLLSAFLLQYVGWVASVVEGFIWEPVVNGVQHVASGVAGVFLAWWCWVFFVQAKRGRADGS